MYRIFSFLFALSIVAAAQAQLDPRQTIYWYYDNFPPYFIITGPYQGKGSGDQQMQILIRHMPQFHHERVIASHNRTLEMMKAQPNVCQTALFKTPERAAEMEYSLPLLNNLPNGFITLRTRLAQFRPFLDEHGQLRIDKFLDDGRYRLGILLGRSFGIEMDRILMRKHTDQKSVVFVSSNDGLSSQLLKLMNQHEYDAVVGYSYELEYVVRDQKLNSRDFVFMPIAEQSPLNPIYVACSKSELGRQIIAAINLALSDPLTRLEIEATYRFWLDEETVDRLGRSHTQSHSPQ